MFFSFFHRTYFYMAMVLYLIFFSFLGQPLLKVCETPYQNNHIVCASGVWIDWKTAVLNISFILGSDICNF